MKLPWSLNLGLLAFGISISTGFGTPQMIVAGGSSVNVAIDRGADFSKTRDLTFFQMVPADAGTVRRAYRISNVGKNPFKMQDRVMNSAIFGSEPVGHRFEDYITFIAAGGGSFWRGEEE